jgi:ligand-binding SRPBCC domain-containing protein
MLTMRSAVLERSQFIPAPIETVFAPFADAANLQAITPPWLHFRIISELPIKMRTGARIAYWLRLHGVPIRWRTRIVAWDPPHRFVDVQTSGPFALWCHTHTFEEVPGGTIARDRVDYRVGFGPIGTLVHRLLVRRDIERIFDYRQEAILQLVDLPSGPLATGQ